ncbi:MAG: hypothetical protein ACJ75B_19425, partial [Flavisolibacter sp.]
DTCSELYSIKARLLSTTFLRDKLRVTVVPRPGRARGAIAASLNFLLYFFFPREKVERKKTNQ